MTARNDKGQFIKGTSGNPGGRPTGLSITALIDAAVTEQDWINIIAKLLERAKRGDIKAIDMLMDRRFGKAAQIVTGKDGEPLTVKLIEVVLPPEDTGDAS